MTVQEIQQLTYRSWLEIKKWVGIRNEWRRIVLQVAVLGKRLKLTN